MLGKFVLVVAALFLFFSPLGLAQEGEVMPPAQPEVSNVAAEAPVPGQVQWVWGEIITIDTQNKAVTIKYPDYDTNQEKEMDIAVDAQTTYSNVNSFEELKPKDAVSVDYTVDAGGKATAKNISVEVMDSQPLQDVAPAADDAAVPQAIPETSSQAE